MIYLYVHCHVQLYTAYLLCRVESGQVDYCLDNLFPLCATHAPNLSWLLAHIV